MAAAADEKWYNLSEMSRLTGINRAQLHKYVKSHSDRIKSHRFGARTKFHESAIAVFEEIRAEGLRRVGKPVTERKKVDPTQVKRKPGRRAVAEPAPEATAAAPRYYTLADMARLTGINRVQLHKLSRTFAAEIPSRKVGGRTQYPAEAADVFRELRDRRRVAGPRPGSTASPAELPAAKEAPPAAAPVIVEAPVERAPEQTAPVQARAVAAPVSEPVTPGSKSAVVHSTPAPSASAPVIETAVVPGGDRAFDALSLAIRFLAAPADVQATIRVLLERAERR